MTGDELLFVLPYLLSLTLAFGIALFTVRRTNVPASGWVAVYAILQCLWILGFLLETFSTSQQEKVFWDDLQFIPSIALGFVIALIIRVLLGRPALPLPSVYRLYLVALVAQIALVYADSWHHLLRPEMKVIDAFPHGELWYPFTPLMYGMIGLFYVVVVTVLTRLASFSLTVTGRLRHQSVWILVGLLVPVVSGLLTAAGVQLGPHRDFTPITFGVGDLIMAWGIFRYRIFDILPVAFETVFNSLDDPLAVVDQEGFLTAHNPAFARFAGSRGPLVGRLYDSILSEVGDASVYDLKTSVIRGAAGQFQGVIHHFRDVSQTRLTALGRMADNVAHELNTPLASMLSAARQLNEGLGDVSLAGPADSPGQQILRLSRFPDPRKGMERFRDDRAWREILEQAGFEDPAAWAERVNNLGLSPSQAEEVLPLVSQTNASEAFVEAQRAHTLRASLWVLRESAERSHQILSALRKRVVAPLDRPRQPAVLANVLDQALEAEEEHRGANVRVLRQFESTASVDALEQRLKQKFQHLIRNAYQAMGEAGLLVLRVRDEKDAVVVEVVDSGPGISASAQNQVFQPYFSTQQPGAGSGFGLEYVKLVAKEHNATLSFESRPGETVFRVSFPRG